MPANTNKSNLARTAILSAAKRAACNNNNTNVNGYDPSTFMLLDATEDEADSSTGVFKQRFDAIDLTDDVSRLIVYIFQKFEILLT